MNDAVPGFISLFDSTKTTLWGPNGQSWNVKLLGYSIERDVTPIYEGNPSAVVHFIRGETRVSCSVMALEDVELVLPPAEISWFALVVLMRESDIKFDHLFVDLLMPAEPCLWPSSLFSLKAGQTIRFNYGKLARENHYEF